MVLKSLKRYIQSCLGPSRTNKTGDLSDIPMRMNLDELEWERQKKIIEIPKDAFRFYLEVKMNGQSHLLEMCGFDKIFDIKAQIMINYKIPIAQILVLKEGANSSLEILNEDRTLDSYGIGVNGTVYVRILKETRREFKNFPYYV